MEYSGQPQAPATLTLGGKPRYLFSRKLRAPQTASETSEERVSFATSSKNGTKDSPFRSLVTCNRDMKEYELEKSRWF